MSTPRIVVLISGGGTTLQNLIDRIADGRLNAEIVLVISNRAGAFGLERAVRAGLAHQMISRHECGDRSAFSEAIFSVCREKKADLVCLAGFLDFVPIPSDFTNRVMNIHPALLPAFGGKGMYGRRVHEAVLASGATISGCTVHFADNEYDHGPIILQKTVPVLAGDTPERLAERVFERECTAYPEAITLFGTGRLKVDGRAVTILPA